MAYTVTHLATLCAMEDRVAQYLGPERLFGGSGQLRTELETISPLALVEAQDGVSKVCRETLHRLVNEQRRAGLARETAVVAGEPTARPDAWMAAMVAEAKILRKLMTEAERDL